MNKYIEDMKKKQDSLKTFEQLQKERLKIARAMKVLEEMYSRPKYFTVLAELKNYSPRNFICLKNGELKRVHSNTWFLLKKIQAFYYFITRQ